MIWEPESLAIASIDQTGISSAKVIRRFNKEDEMFCVRSKFMSLSIIGLLALGVIVAPAWAQAQTSSSSDQAAYAADIAADQKIHIRPALTKCMEKAGTAMFAMHDCYVAENGYQDRRLNQVYKLLMGKLDASGKIQLRDEERKWIKYRESQCALDPAGGQQADLEHDDCWVTEAAKRATVLESRLNTTK